jgi:hypothetical protein
MPILSADSKADPKFVKEVDPKMDRGMVHPREK